MKSNHFRSWIVVELMKLVTLQYIVKPREFVGCFCILILSLMLVACSEDYHDLKHFILTIKQQQTQISHPVPQISRVKSFDRNKLSSMSSPFHFLSKFKPPFHQWILKTYSLNELHFVGSLSSDSKTWALILSPDNQVVRISIGDSLGSNDQRLIMINPDKIKFEANKPQGQKIILNLER